MSPAVKTPRITTIDLSPFYTSPILASPSALQLDTAKALVSALSDLGVVYLIGHGMSEERLAEAFAWSKKLFDLTHEEKMKAPHPPTSIPHRGYSAPGVEKVYSKEERDKNAQSGEQGKELRKVEDYKESYEIGSGSNSFQPNIWLPEKILPRFKADTTALYAELHSCALTLLRAIALGLGLSSQETEEFLKLHSSQNNQLRLLHYPPVEKQRVEAGVVGRMPAHQDWGTFTMLWQDGVGGLEVKDPSTGGYIPADPEREGLGTIACVVNCGDMAQRFSNGILRSAMHRVVLPPPEKSAKNGEWTKQRYSMPYFFAPDHETIVSTLPACVTEQRPLQYEPVKFSEYGEYISKYMYQAEKNRNGN